MVHGMAYSHIFAKTKESSCRSKSIGYGLDLSKLGMGQRTGRWYLLLDDLKVVSTEAEAGGTSLSFQTNLSKLMDLVG